MAQQLQKTLSPYKNQNLFSRHYLNKVIERTDIWDIDEEELEEAFSELEEIYQEQKDLLPHRTDDEEEVRNEFITPILRRVLDFKKEQEKQSGNSQRIPDYALYDTQEKKHDAVESEEYYKHAIGLLEAKAWEKDLEKKTSTGDPSTDDNNPTKQIVDYLIENKPQWGVLTNGKKWRLVHREASNRLDTYYEVDIESILADDRPREERLEEFKYFYIFFRKQAFRGDEGGKVLDEILEESLQYAEDIGEDLEENIYQALEWLAKGYLENNSNDGIKDVPIEEIHDNSLIYLYRLLFALYADSRGILGDPSGKYEYYNFSELVDEVCEELDEGDGYGKSGLIRNRLDAIFRMIDEGSQSQDIPKEELHIPAYNGGLFSQEKHPFLQEYNLHDKYLAKVIDLVARTERDEGGKSRVDYYDLSVRHLGGIYEGLLEYQLDKADEDMVEVKEDGDKVVKTVEDAEDGDSFSDDDIIEEGQPYLVTDDGERKATGSYYTPDYIVKYIVENTVGPKVEEEIEGLDTDKEKAEAILNMQILDPAMGSAHFLVEVIDYLATELVDYKGIEIEEAKRMVARKCVYGVDVNPLATELGKLSIWLKTIAEDRPLSFLDHHIKTGNSLIGADIHNINRHPEENEDSDQRQVTIGEEFGEENAGVVRANVKEMLDMFQEIQEKQAENPDDIKEQERLYEEFLDFPFRKRFDILADVHTSYYFDNDYNVDDYNRLLQAFKLQEQKEEGDEEWSQVVKEDWVQKATDSSDKKHNEDNLSTQKGFFHWKLEFPEVFFDIEEGVEKEDSGFDAVVGNPPYISLSQFDENFKNFLSDNYFSYSGNSDILYYFLESSVDKISKEGRMAFIVARYFLEAEYGSNLRKWINENAYLEHLIDFEDKIIFPGVGVLTAIINLSKDPEGDFDYMNPSDSLNRTSTGLENSLNKSSFPKSKLDNGYWTFSSRRIDEIKSKMEKNSENSLEEISELVQSMQTGKNSVFSISEDKIEEKGIEKELVRPLAKNSSIKKYYIENLDKQIIWTEDIDIEKYPKAKSYLEEFKDELADRYDIKARDANWWEMSNPRSIDLFESDQPRILVPYIANTNRFAVDEEKRLNDGGDIRAIFPAEKYNEYALASILNSSLLEFYHKNNAKRKSGGAYEYFRSALGKLPICYDEQQLKSMYKEQNKKIKAKNKHNLDIRDYLMTSLDDPDGKTLGEMYMPVEGLSDSILTDTKEDRDNIKIGGVKFEESGSSLILNFSVKYKPEEDEDIDEDELDRWGYYETEKLPAMNFTVGDRMKALIKEFVPVAVDEASGFANFREKATKTNSVVDRLEDLTLPKLDDVEQGLEKFIKNKEEAEGLEEEIQETDNQIDAIVFDLYDLSEEEVITVLDSLDTPEDEKRDILENFRSLS